MTERFIQSHDGRTLTIQPDISNASVRISIWAGATLNGASAACDIDGLFVALREAFPERFTQAAPPSEPTGRIPSYLVHIRQTDHPREYWQCEHCGKSMTTPERAGAHICDSLKLDRIEAATKAILERVNRR